MEELFRSRGLHGLTEERIAREKFANYAELLPFLEVGSWATGVALTYMAWGSVGNKQLLAGWLALLTCNMAYQLFRYVRFNKSPENFNCHRENIEQIAAGVFNGSMWGWFVIIFDDIGLPYRILVVCLIIAFCALVSMVAGFNITASRAFIVSSLAPLEIAWIFLRRPHADPFDRTALAITGLTTAIVAFAISRRNHLNTHKQISLKVENQIIASQLAAKNEQLKQANEGKSRLISAASHDLRQPVYGLSLMVSKMRERCRLHNQTQAAHCPVMLTEDDFTDIELALRYLSQSISNLLDLSRLESGSVQAEKKPVNVGELFVQLSYEFAPQAIAKDIDLRIRSTQLAVLADHSLLHSILSNLIANAISYTDSGGILVTARRKDGNCRIYVADQGVGIKPKWTKDGRIFDEYFRIPTEKRGASNAGLGLAIAERFAESMGSKIRVSSIEGKGSCFFIDFPRCAPSQEPALAIMLPGGAATHGFGGTKAMLVTNSHVDSEWILQLLEQNDAITSTCSTIVEAYMWAKKILRGILILDLPQLRSPTPSHDWMIISQIASLSHSLLIVVMVDEESWEHPLPHPFGIANCRLVGRRATPLKLKSILIREIRQRNPRTISHDPNSQRE